MKRWENLRFGIVFLSVCFLFLAVFYRLFYWQVIRGAELSEIGRKQSSQTLIIAAIRGQIRSRDDFPLATNDISYLLYSNPRIINDKQKAAAMLGNILSSDPASVSAQLDTRSFWVKLASNITPEKKREIEKLALKGVGFQQEYSRFYPEASMAAHLIGFVGRNTQGGSIGYFGVEGRYNEQLEGRSGALFAIRDALGNQILGDIREEKKIDGRSLRLTLDRTIQYSADKRLKDGIEKYNADGGTVIVMESASGAILGMSSYPRFDPQKYYEYNESDYKNPALSGLYEPGSTFKVLVMAGALDSKQIKPETLCNICTGPLSMGEYTMRTWNDKYFPNSNMTDVIVHSDNIGMVFVGQKLGLKNMLAYLAKFGLGEQTGIDLQGETSGVLRPYESWYPVDLATASFGQGISVTAIQLATAVNSLANGGRLMQPYVVQEIIEEDGAKIEIKPREKGKTVSSAVSKIVTSMLVEAVERGEAKWTAIKNYKIAGKTGTAQIPVAGHYDPNQTIASFVGYFPASNPKVTMLVLVNRPKTSIYGSETAAPIFFNIARDIIKYYNLPSN